MSDPTPRDFLRALLRLEAQARRSCEHPAQWVGLDREAVAVVRAFYNAVTNHERLRKAE